MTLSLKVLQKHQIAWLHHSALSHSVPLPTFPSLSHKTVLVEPASVVLDTTTASQSDSDCGASDRDSDADRDAHQSDRSGTDDEEEEKDEEKDDDEAGRLLIALADALPTRTAAARRVLAEVQPARAQQTPVLPNHPLLTNNRHEHLLALSFHISRLCLMCVVKYAKTGLDM